MRENITVVKCDTCKENMASHSQPTDLQVIFTTEQTEGRSTKPYLSMQKVDLCDKCKAFILEGHYVFGSGAQGHNDYHIKGRP